MDENSLIGRVHDLKSALRCVNTKLFIRKPSVCLVYGHFPALQEGSPRREIEIFVDQPTDSPSVTGLEVVVALLLDNANLSPTTVVRYLHPTKSTYCTLAHDTVVKPVEDEVHICLDVGRHAVEWIQLAIREFDKPEAKSYGAEAVVPLASLEKFRDVVLKDNFYDYISKDMFFALQPFATKAWQTTAPRGVLLFGPAGTGKSHLCGLIREALGNPPLLSTGVGADLNRQYVGQAEAELRRLQAKAQASPDKLFLWHIDELDSLVRDEEKLSSASAPHKADLATVLMDIMSTQSNILFTMTTNFKGRIDQRLLRAGRASVQFLVRPLGKEQRRKMLDDKIQPALRESKSKLPHWLADMFLDMTMDFTYVQMNQQYHHHLQHQKHLHH